MARQSDKRQMIHELDSAEAVASSIPITFAKRVKTDDGIGTMRFPEGFYQAQKTLEGVVLGSVGKLRARVLEVASADGGEVSEIVGVGLGEKETDGQYTGQKAIKVFVNRKLSLTKLSSDQRIPTMHEGIPTDIVPVGQVRPYGFQSFEARPVSCGGSIGNDFVGAGTIGCLVLLESGKLAVLSNNHVLAGVNRGKPGGTVIYQPGQVDGGSWPTGNIAMLEDYVPVRFDKPNVVDCAVAWTSFSKVSPRHHQYALNPNPVEPSVQMSVRKEGRTTGHTLGDIVAVNVTVNVPYDTNGDGVEDHQAQFEKQFVVRGRNTPFFSDHGDSGSLIVTAGTYQPVGLLFAGGGGMTFANPISEVMKALRIKAFLTPAASVA